MPWLIPSVIAAMTGTIILTYVYFYLYYQDRQRFLYIWGIGWSFYIVNHIKRRSFWTEDSRCC